MQSPISERSDTLSPFLAYIVKESSGKEGKPMNSYPTEPAEGYLVVKVSTARGAIPLEGAAVNIRGGDAVSSGVLYSLRTDRDGQTPRVALSTPDFSESQTPNGEIPYALYHIDVFKEGYLPLFFHNVPIFPRVISIQPAVMVPDTESSR
jgi:hypothetical protein